MKQFPLLTLFLLLSLSNLINAQDMGSDYDPMEKPNIVKLNLLALPYKNFGVQYERILGQHISVACQLRLMPKGSLPGSKRLDDAGSSDSVSFSSWKFGTFAVTPEFRFYPKHAGKGFYLAPYLRYRNMSLDFGVNYIDDQNASQNIEVAGSANTLAGGLMIGSQFRLSDQITLDWFILGFHYGVTNGKLSLKTSQLLSAQDQAEVRADLEEIKDSFGAFNDFDYEVNANGGSISGRFAALGFRGFGLNLGFRF